MTASNYSRAAGIAVVVAMVAAAGRRDDDRHPHEEAIGVVSRALSGLGCTTPVDPYDPDDIDSVAVTVINALAREGYLRDDEGRETAGTEEG